MKKQVNYKVFFPVGICFMGTGITFMAAVDKGLGAAFIVLGVVYIIISIKNKNKWKKIKKKK